MEAIIHIPELKGKSIKHTIPEYGEGIITDAYVRCDEKGHPIMVKISFINGRSSSYFLLEQCLKRGILISEDNLLSSLGAIHDIYTQKIKEELEKAEESKRREEKRQGLRKIAEKYLQLTPYHLAILGGLDDFYDLYLAIQQLFINAYKQEHEGAYTTGDDIFRYKTQLKPEIRKLIDPVARNNLRIICDYDIGIHPNAKYLVNIDDLGDFSFIDIDLVKSRYYYTFITFRSFLYLMQRILAKTILRKTGREPKDYREILTESSLCILEQVEQAKERTIASSDRKKNTESLYVFQSLSSTSCYKYQHGTRAGTYIAQLVGKQEKIVLPVHYCVDCKRYFIGQQTLSLFEKGFGKFIAEKKPFPDDNNEFPNLRLESKLHNLGYNVADGKLTESERQALLIQLMNDGRISYFEICRTIEWNINTFQTNPAFTVAVYKWKADLKFLGEYIKKEQTPENSIKTTKK